MPRPQLYHRCSYRLLLLEAATPKTLSFWQFYAPAKQVGTQSKWFEDCVQRWNATNDVKVELQFVPVQVIWANQDVNVVTIVAWAGVGKSTLVNHWLRRIAAKHYRSAEFVFGWSFYRQGNSGDTSSADEFLDAALSWFGDPDPRLGTAWEKGERLAKLVGHRPALLVLDGLEPAPKSPWCTRGAVTGPVPSGTIARTCCFQYGPVRDYHADAGC